MGRAGAEADRARRLLVTALRTPGRLPDLSEPDWDLLLRVGRRARLLGRLESDLRELGRLEAVPERVAAHLAAARAVADHRKTVIAWEVDRVLWALGGLEVPVTLLKGGAYLLAGLPPARGRLSADLDLLVPEARLGEVEQRLLGRGWRTIELGPYDEGYYRRWMHEVPPLRHGERDTEIDLHHNILPRTSRLCPDPARLMEATRPLADPRLRVLAPSDMVLHALVHLLLEGDPSEGLRLRDLVDVADLLAHFAGEPGFWEGIVPRARRLGLERPLYYGLRYARRVLGTPVPEQVLAGAEAGAPPWPARVLMDRVVPLALFPVHPDQPWRRASRARWLVYVRAHWLRMPPLLLARHLGTKAWRRLRGVVGRRSGDSP